MCRSEDTHPLTFAARTGLTKNKHVPVRSFLFERTSTNESSKLPKYPETDPFISIIKSIYHFGVGGGAGVSKTLIETDT